jgi:hypothetical protein
MFLLLANQFPDYRIVGSRYMKFVDLLSEKTVRRFVLQHREPCPSAPDEPTQWRILTYGLSP